MKKLTLTLLALLTLTLTGCEEPAQEQIDAKIASKITEFNYKGHRYIRYYQSVGHGAAAGITHDPDCPCHKEGGNQ